MLQHECRCSQMLLCSLVQHQTPLEEARQLSAQVGNTVLLKREDMQQVSCHGLRRKRERRVAATPTQAVVLVGKVTCVTSGARQVFSFKLRGAFNKMSQLTEEELARGVICSSAGNHAQGVALAARQLVGPCPFEHSLVFRAKQLVSVCLSVEHLILVSTLHCLL